MRGDQHVIDMRVERLKPDLVFLRVDDEPPLHWTDNPRYFERHPYVYIERGEAIGRLDLRFLFGLQVHLVATSIPRLIEAIHALKTIQLAGLFAVCFDEGQDRITHWYDRRTNRHGGEHQPAAAAAR